MAARQCTPAHDGEQQRLAQALPGTHNTCSTVSQSLSALTPQQCDTATATCMITARAALVRIMDCQRSPPPPPTTHGQHETAPPLQRGGNACVHAAQRDACTRAISHKHNPTQRCAITQQPQRNAVQRRTRDNTKPQSQHCGTAPYSLRQRQLRQCTPKTRVLHRAHDAATMLHISQARCTPHAHAN
jgi:hypothetical protein